MKKLIEQIFKFGIVGVLCFAIDYLLLIGLTELLNINYLISSAISFTVSVIVNYILSMSFVFKSKENAKKSTEFVIFVVLSVIGLGLNQILMWLMVEKIRILYMIAKIFVTAVVMVYNFVTRKLFIEEKTSSEKSDA